jgi:hypothetical protein
LNGALPCKGMSATTFLNGSAMLSLHLGASGNYSIVITGEVSLVQGCEVTSEMYTHISYTVK